MVAAFARLLARRDPLDISLLGNRVCRRRLRRAPLRDAGAVEKVEHGLQTAVRVSLPHRSSVSTACTPSLWAHHPRSARLALFNGLSPLLFQNYRETLLVKISNLKEVRAKLHARSTLSSSTAGPRRGQERLDERRGIIRRREYATSFAFSKRRWQVSSLSR